jgi:hypothetical protein
MSPTRREFIKRVGIALASVVAARCAWPAGKNTPTPDVICYIRVEPTDTPQATGQLDQQGVILTAIAQGDDVDPDVAQQALAAFHRERLRSCWQRFGWLEEQASDWSDYEKGDQAREELIAEHRATLDELVAIGELEADVADLVQEAFAAAAYHVWRANCRMTCYEPLICPDYTAISSDQLVQKAELLGDLADDDSVDQEAVARTQMVIERDIAFLTLSSQDEQAIYDGLMDPSGTSCRHLPLEQLELEVTPEAAEAARFLVELLLEG